MIRKILSTTTMLWLVVLRGVNAIEHALSPILNTMSHHPDESFPGMAYAESEYASPSPPVFESTSLESSGDCIRYSVDNPVLPAWAPNPQDPYIYLSFSSNLAQDFIKKNAVSLENSRLLEYFRESDFRDGTIQPPTAGVIKLFKTLVKDEWVNRVNLPIKFLENHLNDGNLYQKNICFVLMRSLPNFMLGGTAGVNNKIRVVFMVHPLNIGFLFSAFGFLPTVKYTILHELGHALAELKHPKPYQKGIDAAPYCLEVDCPDTVMAYCENKIADRLGPLDIEAGKSFVLDWQRRNEIEHKMINFEDDLKTATLPFKI